MKAKNGELYLKIYNIEALEEENKHLQAAKVDFIKQIDSKNGKIEDLKHKLINLGSHIDEYTEIMKSKDSEIKEKNDTIRVINSELEKLKSDFACDKCDFKAESLTEFIMHVKSPHQTQMETSLSCVECNLNFQREFDLQLHQSSKHPGKAHQFSCIALY